MATFYCYADEAYPVYSISPIKGEIEDYPDMLVDLSEEELEILEQAEKAWDAAQKLLAEKSYPNPVRVAREKARVREMEMDGRIQLLTMIDADGIKHELGRIYIEPHITERELRRIVREQCAYANFEPEGCRAEFTRIE